MAKNIDDILSHENKKTYTNESIEEASNMISKLCERYGSDFAGTYIASLTEDTDLQIREDGDQQNNNGDQQNQNQQNGQQQNQNNQNTQTDQNGQNNQQGQQQSEKPVTQEMSNEFSTIMQSLTKFQEGCKGTTAEKFISGLMDYATKFKNSLDTAVANQNGQNGDQNQQNQQNQNNQNGNSGEQAQNISNQ